MGKLVRGSIVNVKVQVQCTRIPRFGCLCILHTQSKGQNLSFFIYIIVCCVAHFGSEHCSNDEYHELKFHSDISTGKNKIQKNSVLVLDYIKPLI